MSPRAAQAAAPPPRKPQNVPKQPHASSVHVVSDAAELMRAFTDGSAALEVETAISTAEAIDAGFLDSSSRARRDRYARERLISAGRQLVAAIENVVADDELWRRLALSERTLAAAEFTFSHEIALREVLSHELPRLLDLLGYRSPPPSESWTEYVQGSLSDALRDNRPDVGRATMVARRNLVLFLMRLRRAVAQAAEVSGQGVGEDGSQTQRRALAATIRVAGERVVPAALAAGVAGGVGTLLAGPPGGLAALATVMGVETAKEAVKATIEASAVTALSRVSTDSENRHDALFDAFSLLLDGAELLRDAADEEDLARATFITRRSVYDVLQESENLSSRMQHKLWRPMDQLLRVLRIEPVDVRLMETMLAQVVDVVERFLTRRL